MSDIDYDDPEIIALQDDAQRYRYLREKFYGSTSPNNQTVWRIAFSSRKSHCIDAAIDDQIEQENFE